MRHRHLARNVSLRTHASRRPSPGWRLVLTAWVAVFADAASGGLRAQLPTSGLASVRGTVVDSIRGGTIADAYVELVPSGRQAKTDAIGQFRFDSVAPGTDYMLRLMAAVLDTIGITVSTPAFRMGADESRVIDVAVPTGARLIAHFCPPAQLARGPAALVGFIRDPDTGRPIDSVTVSLVYDAGPLNLVKMPVNRVTVPDSTGRYLICGLPAQLTGKVLLRRNTVVSADIPVEIRPDAPLAIRAMGMSLTNQSVDVRRDSAGRQLRVLRGPASLRGRVLSRTGSPIAGARVQMDGTVAISVTGADGAFRLDSVPTGTHAISVRKLGYGVTEAAVDVARYASATVSVVMADYLPILDPVVRVAGRTVDLERVGFVERKARGLGYFREGDELNRGSGALSDALRMIPGIQIGRDVTDAGRPTTLILNARNVNSCVNFFVDGVWWQSVGGDIEAFVRPEEIEALEMYQSTTAPGRFIAPGASNCAVLVLWTRMKIRGKR